ncbi:YtxH domain-containing protein [Candidatus Peregrinibacteria bacterium]|nr:YtxH domain-containing protein [Candidatus Peregrinibacteria bacterium]
MGRGSRLGWLFGLIFGTVFGVLFAPRKGKELREKMKSERKKGKFGIAPLKDDMQHLGQELMAMAKDFYHSETVSDIVEKGRGKVKELSGDWVDEVADFHRTRIKPLQQEVSDKIKFVKGEFDAQFMKGEKTVKAASRQAKTLNRKIKKSVLIGKRAAKEIKKTIKVK